MTKSAAELDTDAHARPGQWPIYLIERLGSTP